jgi:arylsulfatase A-like enzyme
MKRLPYLLFALFFAPSLFAHQNSNVQSAAPSPSNAPLNTPPNTVVHPNIVFILADDMGINDLGSYGRVDHYTPNLDRLAAEGKRFTNAYAPAPICSPTRAAILTGQAPARLQITNFLPGRADWPGHKLLQPALPSGLPTDAPTLAEKFKKIGYATACIGKWHLGDKAPLDAASRGFDTVFAGQANSKPSATEGGKGEFGQAEKASEFLMAHKDGPFFLYLAFDCPHVPLNAQPERVAAKAGTFNPVYAAMVETLDAAAGRVLDKLDELGLRDSTLVVFCSDNGGLHVLEGANTPATINTPYRAGKGFLYEGGLREPLLVRWPGKIAPSVESTPVVLGDLAPTLAALAGAEPCAPCDYANITPLLLGGGSLADRPLFWHMPNYTNQGGRPSGAVLDGDWKLIEHYEDGRLELFNVKADSSEKNDVAATEAVRVAALRGKLEAWRRSVNASMPKANPAFQTSLWEACYGTTDPSRVEPRPIATDIAAALTPWRKAMDLLKFRNSKTSSSATSLSASEAPETSGLVMLEARDAEVHGEKLRYELPPQKDTLGFWVDPRDFAQWYCEIPSSGRYAVEVLQGCVKGGSLVEISVGEASLRFTVEDTGHFQRFVPRRVGILELQAGKTILAVKPVEKKGGAVMDLRRVSLVRVP